VHERHTRSFFDWPSDIEARKMLSAITRRDRTALTKLYMSYYGGLWHFLAQFMGSERRVEDIINDTFIAIWESPQEFPTESKVSVHVFRITYRHALGLMRCNTRHALAHCDEKLARPKREAGTALIAHQPLSWALQSLSAEQGAVLTLCYRMGYSIREIAVITESQTDTVEVRMSHAREQLRRSLNTLETELSTEVFSATAAPSDVEFS
jgi:RNA polymerase sigma-70 factor, ECF subfamily